MALSSKDQGEGAGVMPAPFSILGGYMDKFLDIAIIILVILGGAFTLLAVILGIITIVRLLSTG